MIGSIEELVEQGTKYPEDFYTSSETAYKTHACVFAVHRDSDVLDQSNWSVFCQELGLCPTPGKETDVDGLDGSYIMRSGHWAVGWVETIFVPIYRADRDTWEDGTPYDECYCQEGLHDCMFCVQQADPTLVYSDALLKAYALHEALDHYPVLDEEDYSQREHDDLIETLVNCYDVPRDGAPDCASYLYENGDVCRSDDIGSYTEKTIHEWFVLSDEAAPEWLVKRFANDNDDETEAW